MIDNLQLERVGQIGTLHSPLIVGKLRGCFVTQKICHPLLCEAALFAKGPKIVLDNTF